MGVYKRFFSFFIYKIGCGVKDFFISKTMYGTMGFNLIRVDNSTTDFSFLQCVNPKSEMMKIKQACRSAIRPTIELIKTDKNKIIHHKDITFNKIIKVWLRQNKNIDLSLNKSKDNSQETYFINKETKESFINSHNKLATLIEISIEEHKEVHKK